MITEGSTGRSLLESHQEVGWEGLSGSDRHGHRVSQEAGRQLVMCFSDRLVGDPHDLGSSLPQGLPPKRRGFRIRSDPQSREADIRAMLSI